MKEFVPSPVQRRLRNFNPPDMGRSGEVIRYRKPRNGGHAAMTLIGKPLQYASQIWEKIWLALYDPYRPEQHYMRGPRPKKSGQSIERKSRVVGLS